MLKNSSIISTQVLFINESCMNSSLVHKHHLILEKKNYYLLFVLHSTTVPETLSGYSHPTYPRSTELTFFFLFSLFLNWFNLIIFIFIRSHFPFNVHMIMTNTVEEWWLIIIYFLSTNHTFKNTSILWFCIWLLITYLIWFYKPLPLVISEVILALLVGRPLDQLQKWCYRPIICTKLILI